MQKKVSIIIPVYNVEKYIEECLQSLINQTYTNLEIILIDDGSTDKSGEICDCYKKQDTRIRVIHKTNGGAASAKNIGLKIFNGDYVMFVDSDDMIDVKCIENRVLALEKNDVDIVQSNFINIFQDVTQVDTINLENSIYSKEGFLLEYIQNWQCALFWNKLYKREVIEGLKFVEGRCIDDEFFTYKVIQTSTKIAIMDSYDYYYRQRRSSVMNNPSHKKKILNDQVEFIYMRFLDIDKNNKSIRNEYLENLVDTYLLLSKSYFLDKNILNSLKNNIKSILLKIITYKFKNSILKILIIKLILTPSCIILKNRNNLENKEEKENRYFE